jgi:hypothetical protein
MARAWTDADPSGNFNDPGAGQVGLEHRAEVDITITQIWVWSHGSDSIAGRKGYLWNPATQTQLADLDLPAVLPAGWSGHDLVTPVVRTAGQRWIVSFTPGGKYGATPGNLTVDRPSSDGAVTTLATGNATNGNGLFTTSTTGFPNQTFGANRYGADVGYELGTGETHAPVIHSVEVGTDDLDATVMIEATDEDGGTLTYTVTWGDGAVSTGTAATVSHTYALAGAYPILVKVTDPTTLSAFSATLAIVSAPVPIVGDPLVMPLARELLACYEAELAKLGDNAPAYIGLRPGTVVDFLLSTTDDECCAGLAWVRPASFFPSSAAFPNQDTVAQKQGTRAWAVTLEMGIVRCAPTPDENSIPSNDQWDDVTQAVMDASAAMRRAICCWIDMDPVRRKQKIIPGTWQPVAVQGGCVGGILPVTIMGPACDCSDAGLTSS